MLSYSTIWGTKSSKTVRFLTKKFKLFQKVRIASWRFFANLQNCSMVKYLIAMNRWRLQLITIPKNSMVVTGIHHKHSIEATQHSWEKSFKIFVVSCCSRNTLVHISSKQKYLIISGQNSWCISEMIRSDFWVFYSLKLLLLVNFLGNIIQYDIWLKYSPVYFCLRNHLVESKLITIIVRVVDP